MFFSISVALMTRTISAISESSINIFNFASGIKPGSTRDAW